jgi:hypothetical protein
LKDRASRAVRELLTRSGNIMNARRERERRDPWVALRHQQRRWLAGGWDWPQIWQNAWAVVKGLAAGLLIVLAAALLLALGKLLVAVLR